MRIEYPSGKHLTLFRFVSPIHPHEIMIQVIADAMKKKVANAHFFGIDVITQSKPEPRR